MTNNLKPSLRPTTTPPAHEKLPWPGLKAKDHLSRVISRALKEAKDTRENEAWAEDQIAHVLDYVSPEAAIKLVLREARCRKQFVPGFTKTRLRVMGMWER
jgi:hypothetical protein